MAIGKILAHEIVNSVVPGDINGPIVLDCSVRIGGGLLPARLGSLVVGGDVRGAPMPDPTARNRITVHGVIEHLSVLGSMGSSSDSPNRAFTLHCVDLQNLFVAGEMRGQIDTTYTGAVYNTGEQGVIRSLRVNGNLAGTAFGADPDTNIINDAVRTGNLGQTAGDLGLSVGDDAGGQVVIFDEATRPIEVEGRLEKRMIIQGNLQSSINIAGDVIDTGAIVIEGNASGPITVGDDLMGDLIVGGAFTSTATIHGDHFGVIDVFGNVTGAIDIAGDAVGTIELNGNLAGAAVVTGDVLGDISIGGVLDGDLAIGNNLYGDVVISTSEGLLGQITVNTEDDAANFWFGDVVVGATTLGLVQPPATRAPYYTTGSASLGGGAVGLARFDYHPADSVPARGAKLTAAPAFVTLSFYGPVAVVDDDPLQTPVVVERAPALVILPWGCTSPCEQGCGGMMGWTDISDQFSTLASGRDIEVYGPFEAGYRYRVRSREGTDDRVVCVGVDGSPVVRLHAPNPIAGCTDTNYIFSVLPLEPFDLTGDGLVDPSDLAAWAGTPTDLDETETVELADLALLSAVAQ